MHQRQGRVLIDQLDQGCVDFLLVGFGLGGDCGAVGPIRIVDRGDPDWMVAPRQGVTSRCVLQLADPGDVTGADLGGGFQGLALGKAESTQTLRGVARCVDDRQVVRQGPGEDLDVADPTNERIGRGLENQRGHRSRRVGLEGFSAFGPGAHRADLVRRRGRQQIHDGVEEGAHPDRPRGGGADRGHDIAARDPLCQGRGHVGI